MLSLSTPFPEESLVPPDPSEVNIAQLLERAFEQSGTDQLLMLVDHALAPVGCEIRFRHADDTSLHRHDARQQHALPIPDSSVNLGNGGSEGHYGHSYGLESSALSLSAAHRDLTTDLTDKKDPLQSDRPECPENALQAQDADSLLAAPLKLSLTDEIKRDYFTDLQWRALYALAQSLPTGGLIRAASLREDLLDLFGPALYSTWERMTLDEHLQKHLSSPHSPHV